MVLQKSSAKRFGVRYGRRIRDKVGKIEAARRASTLCPYCRAKKAHRKAVGIWHCKKCDATFTGRAYTINNPKVKNQIRIQEKDTIQTTAV